MRSWLIYELIKVNVGCVIFITNFQAEKFGDSFVLEGKISEEIKKDIHQAVSGCFIQSLIHYWWDDDDDDNDDDDDDDDGDDDSDDDNVST